MAKQHNWRDSIPKNFEDAYTFFRNTHKELLNAYDSGVLGGYDIGKEASFLIHTTPDYDGVCKDVLIELESVALRRALPNLPLERILDYEPKMYALRRVFSDLVRANIIFDDVMISSHDSRVQKMLVLREAYVTMRNLVKYRNGGKK